MGGAARLWHGAVVALACALGACGSRDAPLVRVANTEDSLGCLTGTVLDAQPDPQLSRLAIGDGLARLSWVDASTDERVMAELDPTGDPVGPPQKLTGRLGAIEPSLAHDGTGWWVGFHNHFLRGAWHVYAARLGSDESLAVPEATPLSADGDPESQRPIVTPQADGGLAVTYRRQHHVVLVTLDASLVELGRGDVLKGTPIRWPRALLRTDDGWLVHVGDLDGAHDTSVERFAADAAHVATPFSEEDVAASALTPAPSGDGFVLASSPEAGPDVHLRGLAADGTADGRTARLPFEGPIRELALATGPTSLGLVAVHSDGTLWFAEVPDPLENASGVTLRALGSGNAERPTVAWLDGGFLIAWQDVSTTPPTIRVERPCAP